MSSASSTFASGASPTATQVNGWEQGALGYAQVTANQGSISTTPVDLTGLTVTATVVANRRLRIIGRVQMQNTGSTNVQSLSILQDGVSIMQHTWPCPLATTNFAVWAEVVVAPSAGSHTWKLQANCFSAGTSTMAASAAIPAFILVEDIGAV